MSLSIMKVTIFYAMLVFWCTGSVAADPVNSSASCPPEEDASNDQTSLLQIKNKINLGNERHQRREEVEDLTLWTAAFDPSVAFEFTGAKIGITLRNDRLVEAALPNTGVSPGMILTGITSGGTTVNIWNDRAFKSYWKDTLKTAEQGGAPYTLHFIKSQEVLDLENDVNFVFVTEYAIVSASLASHSEVWFCPQAQDGWSDNDIAKLQDLTKKNRRKAKGFKNDYQKVDESWWESTGDVRCWVLSYGGGDNPASCSGVNTPEVRLYQASRGPYSNAVKYYYGLSDHNAQAAYNDVCRGASGVSWSEKKYSMAAPRHNCQEFGSTITKCDLKLEVNMPAWHQAFQRISCSKYDESQPPR